MSHCYTMTVEYDAEKDPEHDVMQRLMEVMYEVSGFESVRAVKLVPGAPGERVVTVDFVPGVEQGNGATQ